MNVSLRRFGPLVVLLLAATAGCGRPSYEPPARAIDYEGPPVEFSAETGAAWTQFNWQVTAPSGGWEAKFLGAMADENHAVIRVRLTKPGADEVVTQALETLTGEYRHDVRAFKSAELQVSIQTRGAEATDRFKIAATWP